MYAFWLMIFVIKGIILDNILFWWHESNSCGMQRFYLVFQRNSTYKQGEEVVKKGGGRGIKADLDLQPA